MTKICTGCGEEKPLDEYHKHKGGAHGLNPKCKSCRKEFDRTDRGRELSSARKIRYRSTETGKIKHRANAKKSRELWPEKHKARDAVNHSVASGKIVKPNECSSCGCGGVIHGHHSSYEKVDWLDVVWLCTKCHNKVHFNEGVAVNEVMSVGV